MATTEYMRFTVREVLDDKAKGWAFASGWFQTPGSYGPWAWFRRDGDG